MELGLWPGVMLYFRTRAEEVGFEPTVALRPQRFSRPSDSSALALLQVQFCVSEPARTSFRPTTDVVG